jgi:hypothetical protein
MNVSHLITSFLVAHKTLAKLLRMPYMAALQGVPVIIPSSGSMGNNGAITLTTALPAIYASCYLYLPANAISAGSSAGFYYAVMTSTTVGTVYNNTYTSGTPTIPASPTAFVTTGPGAYTQTTGAELALLEVTIPGGAMGKNGSLMSYPEFVYSNSANTKTLKLYLGATAVITLAPTTTSYNPVRYFFRNRGAEAVNFDNSGAGFGAGTATPSRRTINTTADFVYKITGQLAAATDYIILEVNLVQLNPSN